MSQSQERQGVSFATPGQVDEALAYTHAGIIHEALERAAELEDSLPHAVLRPFRRGETDATGNRIRNVYKKTAREFDEIERVVVANRRQGEVLAYLFDYSPGEYDPEIVAQALGDPAHQSFSAYEAGLNIKQTIEDAYRTEQSAKLQFITFHIFDSLSAEPQPSGKSVRAALDWLGFNKPIATDPQFTANKQRDPSGNVETYATIFPPLDTADGRVAQDQRSLTAYYNQVGPDVAVSAVVAIQARLEA